MRIFKNSKNTKRILIVLVFLLLFNFTMPAYANAAEDWTGKLIEPLADLICSIGDGLINVMQGMMLPGSPQAVQKRSLIIDNLIKNGKLNNFTGAAAEVGNIVFNNPVLKVLTAPYTSLIAPFVGDVGEVFKKTPIPAIYYSSAAIFANKIPALDVNFINPSVDKYEYLINIKAEKNPGAENTEYIKLDENSDEATYREALRSVYAMNQVEIDNATRLRNQVINNKGDEKLGKPGNTAVALKGVISRWYIALRNIAIVGLMIVLLYVGIRILVSSTGEENAKYKTMIKDWVMAMILVFSIHFIMLGMLTLTEAFINMLDSNSVFDGGQDVLMNHVRLLESRARVNDQESKSWLDTFGYAIMYTTLVIYTLIFTFQYLKRTIYMAFLTIIAPLVALTYPIDKIRDGKAQAFNMWIKEYMFNLLIQPIHLLLYTVLVTSAIELAVTNILYSLVAIGFLLQAEKFIKKMFGFQAEGGAFGGGFASGAMFSGALNALKKGTSKVTGALSGGSKSKGSDGGNGGNSKLRQQGKISESGYETDLGAFNSGNQEVTGRDTSSTRFDSDNANIGIDDGRNPAPGMMLANNIGNQGGELTGASTERLGLPGMMSPNSPEHRDAQLKLEDLKETKRKINAPYTRGQYGKGTREFNSNLLKRPKPTGKAKKFINTKAGRKMSSIGSGMANVGRRYVNKENGIRLAKFAARTGVRATLGAVGGTIGIAAGLASDDYSNAFKYGALGFGGGAVLGGEVAKQGGHVVNKAAGVGTNARDDYLRGIYNNDEYQRKVVNPKIERNFLNDKQEQDYYRQEYGGKDYKNKMKDAIEFQKYGITDQEQIRQAVKVKDKSALPIQEIATASKYVNNIKKEDLTNQQGIEKIRKSIAHRIHKEEDQNRFLKTMGQLEGINENFMPLDNNKKT